MRVKKDFIVLSFESTEDAMEMEGYGKREPLFPGRLIPLPAEISAGCGFAWKCPLEQEEALFFHVKDKGLNYGGSYIINMWDVV